MADLSKKQLDRTLAQFDAAIDASPEMLSLATKLQNRSEELFAIAAEAKLVGQNLENRDDQRWGTNGERLQFVAENVANAIGKTFGSGQFTSLFKGQTLAEDWTLGDAVAVWHSLGNLVLLVAASAAYRNASRVAQVYETSRLLLLKLWQLSSEGYQRFRSVTENSRAQEDLRSFRECKNGTELLLFFSRYVNRILGKPEILEIGNERIVNSCDPVMCIVVCEMFVDVCSGMKDFMLANTFFT